MAEIIEIFKTNPALYFLLGLILGYVLRSLNISSYHGKQRPGRYHSVRPEKSDKKREADHKSGFKEPSFDWAARAANPLVQNQTTLPLNPPGNQV